MAVLDLSQDEGTEYSQGIDGVAIKHYVHGKEGGAVLDTTGFPDDYIYEGHGVIKDADGNYKPLPVDGAVPEGSALVGVVRSTTRKSKPSTGVMTQGTINNNVVKYPFNEAALTALKEIGIYNQED